MALGNNQYTNNGPLYLLTPRSKDKNKQDVPPHFEIAHYEGDQVVKEDRTVTSVGGDLFKVEFKQREFEGNVTEDAVFYLRDKSAGEGGESYRVPIRFGTSGRSLFNAFASLADKDDFSNLQLDYYRSKKGYDSYGLKQNGEKVSWKYELKDMPQPIEIKHPVSGKVLQRDYSAINDFLKAELLKIAAKVNKGGTTPASTPAKAPAAAPAEKPAQDSEIPF